jgi:hypothetical protein
MRHPLVAIGIFLLTVPIARAEVAVVPVADEQLMPPGSAPLLGPPPPVATPPEAYNQPLTAYPDPLREPPWCESPYRNSAWRAELSFIPHGFASLR